MRTRMIYRYILPLLLLTCVPLLVTACREQPEAPGAESVTDGTSEPEQSAPISGQETQPAAPSGTDTQEAETQVTPPVQRDVTVSVLPTASAGGSGTVFSPLPLGQVQAASWLKNQLLLQAEYMTGQMEAVSPDVKSTGAGRSGWLGGSGEAWERGTYYVRGLVSLAYVLQDKSLIEKAQPWIEWTLASQTESGCFGPYADDPAHFDYWPLMPMLMALEEYADATGDERILPFLERYFTWEAESLKKTPLSSWGAARGGDNIFAVWWLYEKTGDESLRDLAALLYSQTDNWASAYSETAWSQTYHIVNVHESFKLFPVMYALTGEQKWLDIYYQGVDNLYMAAGRADGMSNGDEVTRGISAVFGTETCAVVERMLCDEIALYITRDPALADHLELLAYNALPQQYLPDMNGQVYFTMQNQIYADMGNHGFTSDGGDRSVYGFPGGYPCCAHNCHMGWPLFVSSLWMGTGDSGLAVGAYGPCSVTAEAGGVPVTVTETTDYPFEETVTLTLRIPAGQASFPLYLRVPEWCRNASVSVNGYPVPCDTTADGYLRLAAEWHDGDTVTLVFPRTVRTEYGENNSVSVKYGALLFAVEIGEKWEVVSHNPENWRLSRSFKSYNITPTTAWNLALSGLDPAHPESVFTVTGGKAVTSDMTFRAENAPLVLTAAGVSVPGWTEDKTIRAAGRMPLSPLSADAVGQETVTVRLIPYAFTRLRIALMPWTAAGDTVAACTAAADGASGSLTLGNVIMPDGSIPRNDGGFHACAGTLVFTADAPAAVTLRVTVNGKDAGTLALSAGQNSLSLSSGALSSQKHNRVVLSAADGGLLPAGLTVSLTVQTEAAEEVRYEAENAGLSGGLYASGDHVAGIDREGDTLSFRVDAEESGTYLMRVFYTDPMGEATLDVLVDRIRVGTLTFFKTSTGWGGFDPANHADLPLELAAGTHTVQIVRTYAGGNSAELDAFTLLLTEAHPVEAHSAEQKAVRYEAEKAALTGGLYVSGNHVAGIDKTDDRLDFEIEAPASGVCTLYAFHTAPMGHATLTVQVDGQTIGKFSFAATTTGWGGFDPNNYAVLKAEMTAGTHTLTVVRQADDESFAELDAVELVFGG